MQSVKYLQRVQEKYGLPSATALALKLGLSKQAVSNYLNGNRVMDENTCLAVAIALEMSEHETMQVLMAAGMDRAHQTGQQSLWEVFSKRMAATAASALVLAGVTLFLTPQNAEARTYSPASSQNSNSLYIMSNELATEMQ